MKRQNVVLDETFTKSDRENAEKKKWQLSEKVKPPKNLSISFNLTRKVYRQPLTISNRPSFLLSYVQTMKGDHWQTYSLSVGKHCRHRAERGT